MNGYSFTVERSGVEMQCRLYQRTGGYGGGGWVLAGYVRHEERMGCDVTTTVRKHSGNRQRLIAEITDTAQRRLRQITG